MIEFKEDKVVLCYSQSISLAKRASERLMRLS